VRRFIDKQKHRDIKSTTATNANLEKQTDEFKSYRGVRCRDQDSPFQGSIELSDSRAPSSIPTTGLEFMEFDADFQEEFKVVNDPNVPADTDFTQISTIRT
jgi:hypothetical protein